MYRYFGSLPHRFCPREPGIVVAENRNESQRYPDGRSIGGYRAEIRLDIAVRGYEDSRKYSETGLAAAPETEAVIP
jgi:hypothetical protein